MKMEIRRGTVTNLRTHLVTVRSLKTLALFDLDGMAMSMDGDQPSYRSREPALMPFKNGDELVVAGRKQDGSIAFFVRAAYIPSINKEITDKNCLIIIAIGILFAFFMMLLSFRIIYENIPASRKIPVLLLHITFQIFGIAFIMRGFEGRAANGMIEAVARNRKT